MLRLVYADQGTKEELLDAVRAARRWAERRFAEGGEQVRGYLDDGGPFPDRLHIIALFAHFYADLFELVVRWAELAEAEIERWPRTDGLGMTERTRALLEELVRRLDAAQAAGRAPSGLAEQGGSVR
jgi:AcrR family transcriptional regulator